MAYLREGIASVPVRFSCMNKAGYRLLYLASDLPMIQEGSIFPITEKTSLSPV